MLLQQRKKVWEGLSLESKEFVSKYLQEVLGLGEDWEAHEKFLFPKYEEELLDGADMHDMDKAVGRILRAIKRKEKIVVYGDYDCDGVPATALMRDFFEKIKYQDVTYYIPHRHTEGYGLNKVAIENFSKEGIKLILTLDLGTTNLDEIKYANNLQIDVVVTDHHLPQETEDGQILPPAFAILNNKKHSCQHANKDLCGTGMAFKLVTELIRHGKKEGVDGFENIQNGYEKWLLDLVAIATISDMMPLIGENRTLVMYGLYVLQKTNRAGLQTLFQNTKTAISKITEDEVGFVLGPRINAASRIAHPRIALSLFSSNLQEGINSAHELEEINQTRKDLTNNICRAVYKVLDSRLKQNKLPKIVVVGDADWNVGVAGIVAQKIVEKYKVTCFVFAGHDGANGYRNGDDACNSTEKTFKGSCRSVGDVHLIKLMSLCKDEFVHFGGHILAGGFEIAFSKIHTLEKILNENLEYAKIEAQAEKKKKVFSLELEKINEDFLQALDLLRPFGVGNEKPLFQIQNFTEAVLQRFGKNKEHLKIILTTKKPNTEIKREAVKFYTEESEEKEILEKLNRGELLFEIEAGWNTNIPRLKIVS